MDHVTLADIPDELWQPIGDDDGGWYRTLCSTCGPFHCHLTTAEGAAVRLAKRVKLKCEACGHPALTVAGPPPTGIEWGVVRESSTRRAVAAGVDVAEHLL